MLLGAVGVWTIQYKLILIKGEDFRRKGGGEFLLQMKFCLINGVTWEETASFIGFAFQMPPNWWHILSIQ